MNIALANTILGPRELRFRVQAQKLNIDKKGVAGFVLFVVCFLFATLVYTLIAVYAGVIDKIQIAFSLSFVVLLALVYVIYHKAKGWVGL